MTPGADPPVRIFHIGFDRDAMRPLVGALRKAELSVPARGQDVARNIFYSIRRHEAPLARYRETVLFDDLESTDFVHREQLFGQEQFEFLDDSFPDALFILTSGDDDAVVKQRWRHRRGMFRRSCAVHLDVDEAELPGLWTAHWRRHHQACRDHFGSEPRFLDLDCSDGDPHGLFDHVSDLTGLRIDVPRRRRPNHVVAAVDDPPEVTRPSADGWRVTAAQFVSTSFADSIVEFATRRDDEVATSLHLDEVSHCYAHWHGDREVVNRRGRALRCAVDFENAQWPFLFDTPKNSKHGRTEGVLNELYRLGSRRGAALDMQDARRFGTSSTGALEWPVYTYTRLAGASNLVLWPLPGYHTPGAEDYPATTSTDTRPFESKRDHVAWRGNLTGRALADLGDAGLGNEPVSQLVRHPGAGADDRPWLPKLMTVPRFRVVSRLAGRPDADVALVLEESLRFLQHDPDFVGLIGNHLSYDQLYENRYLLSLSGNDTGSNFLKAVDSHSVVLKEEDGWETFYSSVFEPWVHYIPIERGGDDIPAKLDWARSNPKRCIEMTAEARHVVRLLTNEENRLLYLRGISQVYESRL